MEPKIKILLFSMIAGAGLIVVSAFINVRNYGDFGANIGQIINGREARSNESGASQSPRETAKSDIDQDGLFDEEEPLYRTDPLNKDTDGDGFLDGEEVAAGCSPISASPKDCQFKPGLSRADINFTDYFASLIVGGLLTNDLSENNPRLGSYISGLQNEVLAIQKSLLSIDVDIKMETNAEDSKKSSQEYLDNLENILRSHFLKKETKIELNDLANLDY